MSNEHLRKTENEKIFVEERPVVDRAQLCSQLMRLREAAEQNDRELVFQRMHELVPTFRTPEEVNRQAVEKMRGKIAV